MKLDPKGVEAAYDKFDDLHDMDFHLWQQDTPGHLAEAFKAYFEATNTVPVPREDVAELEAWREHLPAAGFDGKGIVWSG